ncbi:glycosyltransferase family 2 protein [Alkalihalophilus marmarensis]|uniref:glycosyltransferase family 2 protein n=1 Tax=Alkalihalophilus marmarensis TaxID=521377 RepID=UPI002DB64309|nr:glycosyltransferase family 2 protein [Alkalihalophilus marmarensis]MEC2073848.1 glycosyltransferase family 2 protein [Alkalihalophilus marmarensis]
MNNVSVIIPAYNEEVFIKDTIDALRNIPGLLEIIIINDGSTDQTSTIAHQYADHVIDLSQNKGKGNALKIGWQAARGEFIACVDADLGRSAVELKNLIVPIQDNLADLVISKVKAGDRAGFGFVKRRAQSIILKYTGAMIEAPLSGQRIFHRKWLDLLLNEEYNGFGVETKMTIDFLLAGAVVKEVETSMTHREMGKSPAGFMHRLRQWIDIERQLRFIRMRSVRMRVVEK